MSPVPSVESSRTAICSRIPCSCSGRSAVTIAPIVGAFYKKLGA